MKSVGFVVSFGFGAEKSSKKSLTTLAQVVKKSSSRMMGNTRTAGGIRRCDVSKGVDIPHFYRCAVNSCRARAITVHLNQSVLTPKQVKRANL